jgi:hypothetical protein
MEKLQKALEDRLDVLVGEFGVIDGLDRWELEVQRLLTAIMIHRLGYYMWRDVGEG